MGSRDIHMQEIFICIHMQEIFMRSPEKFFFPLRATPLFSYSNNIGKKAIIGKYFLQSPLLLQKIWKNSSPIIVKKYTTVNFFRIFEANLRFLTSKTCFFAFIFFRELINNHEFFQNFWSQFAPMKNFWIIDRVSKLL